MLACGVAATPALAASSSAVYVSPTGSSTGADTSCQTAGYSDINAAIAAVSSGGKVVVCPGTYKTQAVVTKPLTLVGAPGAEINAKGQPPLKIGSTKLPGSIGIGVLGIIAGHSTAGVSHNAVYGNLLSDNGTLASSGGGAGVVIATEVPGETVADNTVSGNVIWGNGISGVTIHAHEPGQDLNGNVITGNWIGTNNTLGDFIDLAPKPGSQKNVAQPDLKTTGILVGSASPIAVRISGNHISADQIGIFTELLKSAVSGSHLAISGNTFLHVPSHVKHVVVPASS